jgi:hypothetical protein
LSFLHFVAVQEYSGGILYHKREVCNDHSRQLQAAEVLSKLSTLNDKSSLVPVMITMQLVINKQFKLGSATWCSTQVSSTVLTTVLSDLL